MDSLYHASYFTVFLIISLGFLLGKIKIRGISFDVSAVIFVALFFGHMGVSLPSEFGRMGLLFFIFTIGMQAGPAFFSSFRKKGLVFNLLAVLTILFAAIVTAVLAIAFGVDHQMSIGLFTGALTSTPGLAAAIEATNSPLASIGYGIGYPFGVIGVILFVKFLPYILRKKIETAEKEFEAESIADHPEIISRNFVVDNANIEGKSIGELKIRSMTGANVSRIMHNGIAITPQWNTVLHSGDIIKAVGTHYALERMKVLIGHETEQEVDLDQAYDVQSILVTRHRVLNMSLSQLNLKENYNAVITRIRRSGIDISATPGTRIMLGDKVTVAASKENMRHVVQLLGNNENKLSETDFFPIAMGIVLGMLAGQIKLSFENFSFSPGLTGGVLAIGLLLGRVGRTGPILWTMSGAANGLLRQLGLLLFLASVGCNAGSHLAETFAEYGYRLFVFGAIITTVPMIITTAIGHYVFKINMLSLMGTLTGGMTSTPGLAAINSASSSNAAHVAYATVYPVALVMVIVCAQLLTFLGLIG